MSIVAICPASDVDAVNAALEAQGFGPRNLSVPVMDGAASTHALAHCWGQPAFLAALSAIPEVTVTTGAGRPADLVSQAIASASVTATWGGAVERLDAQTNVAAGEIYRWGDGNELWRVVQGFDRAVFGAPPETYPALLARQRVPGEATPWVQPLGAFDAYQLVNPFTGEPDRATHEGQTWVVTGADGGGNNVWAPGVFGWTAE